MLELKNSYEVLWKKNNKFDVEDIFHPKIAKGKGNSFQSQMFLEVE